MASNDVPQPAPFFIARDLLESNLETRQAEGYSCPHCQIHFLLKFKPDTKDAIINLLAQGNFHDKLIFCDNNDCSSVKDQKDGSFDITPFVRRISAADDGSVTVETLSIDELLEEIGDLRKRERVVRQDKVTLKTAHQQEIDALRRGFDERLAAAVAKTTQLDAGLRQDTAAVLQDRIAAPEDLLTRADALSSSAGDAEKRIRDLVGQKQILEKFLDEIDRIAGVKETESRLGVIGELAGAARQLQEACSLGGITPEQLIENAETWSRKQQQAGQQPRNPQKRRRWFLWPK